jgi:cobalamin biosynthesis Mg chelatase CobN
MRSTCRLFMAAILLTMAAGVASAQDASAAPPPSAPDVANPVAQLPPIPIAEPSAPAVQPALTVDQSALTVEPAPPALDPPAAEKLLTTASKRVTKKTAKKPAQKPAIQVSESVQVGPTAASTAAVDTTANMPPSDAAAKAAPPTSIAPPAPSVQAAAVEGRTEETKSKTTMGIGGWLLALIAVAALVGVITMLRRRKARRRISIVQLANLSLDLEPAPATRL